MLLFKYKIFELKYINQGRMQGAATTANIAPQKGSH